MYKVFKLQQLEQYPTPALFLKIWHIHYITPPPTAQKFLIEVRRRQSEKERIKTKMRKKDQGKEEQG